MSPRYEPYAPDAVGRPAAVSLRPAAPSDAVRISEIDGQRSEVPPESIVDPIRGHLEKLHRGDRVLVAEIDGRVVGFGRLRWVEVDETYRNVATGWFLVGVLVAPEARRQGVGRALLEARLGIVAEEGGTELYYMANAQNLTTVAFHRPYGFEELTRDFVFPRVDFAGGVGVLFRARLPARV